MTVYRVRRGSLAEAGAGTAMGSMRYATLPPPSLFPSPPHPEIGYWLLPQFWKQGIITEAMPALLRYMRQEKGIHRIEAMVEEGNTASNRLLERMGFVYEGTLRDCEIKDGHSISLRIYSLLSTDPARSEL